MKQYHDYIIKLKYIGPGKRTPDYLKKERGVGRNEPIFIAATSMADAKSQLILPKSLKVKSVKKRGCPAGKQYNIPKKKCMEKKR
jgi:hypothetical protein